MSKLPLDVEVHASGFAEPYLNPDCGSFIVRAVAAGHKVHIYSTLVGMRQAQAESLAIHPPEYFRVHVPDKSGLKLPDDLWIKQHKLFLQHGGITALRATYMAMGAMTAGVSRYLENLSIAVELPDMLSRAGNLWEPKNIAGRPMRCGPNRWHQNVVLPNGDVVGDCMDYGLTVPLGNLLTDDYADIYAAAEQWRTNMETCASGICATCEWAAAA